MESMSAPPVQACPLTDETHTHPQPLGRRGGMEVPARQMTSLLACAFMWAAFKCP